MPSVPQSPLGKPIRIGSLRARRVFAPGAAAVLVLFLSGCASVEGQPSALNPKGPAAVQVAILSWLMFTVAALVTLVVTALLIAAFVRGRRFRSGGVERVDLRPGQAPPGDRRTLTLVMIGGAVVPAVVLIAMMSLSISFENRALASAPDSPVIEVIGHQWWWEVRYPEQAFETANEIHIPVGRPVTFKLSSEDVVHSFWVPQLHPKLDMIPGQVNTLTLQADEEGTYRGACAEYCGKQHAHMQLLIIAEPQGIYDQWISQQQKPAAEPAEGTPEQKGQQVFLGAACVSCHTIRGTNAAGQVGPDLTHLASRSTIGAGARPNSGSNLSGWIINSQSIKPGNMMPPIDMEPEQLQSLLAYLQSLN